MTDDAPFTGFSQRWSDFPDYILGITQEIWEGRGIATLHDYYAKDVVMRFPNAIVTGNDAVMAGTMATIAEFPDRQLFGEDVIWSGDAETGYLSSHRIVTTGTHLHDGAFGPATGRSFQIRVIADCAAKNNTIYDEWLIRDYSGIALQLGLDPKEIARQSIEDEGGPDQCIRPFTPDQDIDGGYHGTGNDNEWGERYADILTRIMDLDFAVIDEAYDRAVISELPGARTELGREQIGRFWLSLRSSFPKAEFRIHHQIGRDDPMMPPRAALRWSLTGKHDGWGAFGKPTGAQVHIMGLSHAEFGPFGSNGAGVRREYVLNDDISIWKQILMQSA